MKKQEAQSYEEELVPVTIHSNGDDSDAVVIINGYTYVIQKDQTVYVPRKVALVLEDSMAQKREAKRYIKSLVRG
nr:MAG TPA: hypothetical protein [Caudoviricetes sp.]